MWARQRDPAPARSFEQEGTYKKRYAHPRESTLGVVELWITGPPIALGLLSGALRPPMGWTVQSEPDRVRLTAPDPTAAAGTTRRESELQGSGEIAEDLVRGACVGRDDIHPGYFNVRHIGELGDWS
jgi:hypothetical protein